MGIWIAVTAGPTEVWHLDRTRYVRLDIRGDEVRYEIVIRNGYHRYTAIIRANGRHNSTDGIHRLPGRIRQTKRIHRYADDIYSRRHGGDRAKSACGG